MATETETIRVHVTANQRVYYDQVLIFTRAEWEHFKALSEKGACEELGDRIDSMNIISAEPIDDDFEAEVVDEHEQPVKPADQYEGE